MCHCVYKHKDIDVGATVFAATVDHASRPDGRPVNLAPLTLGTDNSDELAARLRAAIEGTIHLERQFEERYIDSADDSADKAFFWARALAAQGAEQCRIFELTGYFDRAE